MRHIDKQKQSIAVLDREQLPNTSDKATRRWKRFASKQYVTNILLLEQNYLCTYSEVSLGEKAEDSLGAHIEHVQPKSVYPQRTFDYHNLVVSALSSDSLQGREKHDVFGGHAKGSQYNENQFISCLQSDCASYFSYLSDGRVVPVDTLERIDKARAVYTIDLLNLNSHYLINRRKNWIDELDAEIDNHLDNDLSLECLASVDLLPRNGQLSPFFSATRQRLGGIADIILSEV